MGEADKQACKRADVLVQIQKAIVTRGLKQAEAAKLLGVTHPRVSDLVRGRLDLFSVDGLIRWVR